MLCKRKCGGFQTWIDVYYNILTYRMHFFRNTIFSLAVGRGSCARALGCGARRGTPCTRRCKCGPRPGSVARALGVQSRAIRQVITGSLSDLPEPSRLMEIHNFLPQGGSAVSLYLQQLYDAGTAHTLDCLAVLARGTAHTACFHLSGCTRSSFLCG